MAFTNKYNLQDSLSRSHKIHLSVIRILDTMFCAPRERNMNSKENCFRERKKPCLTSVNFIEFRFFPIIAKSVRDVFNINKNRFCLVCPDLAIIQAFLLLSFEHKTLVV